MEQEIKLKIGGMSCNHCKNFVSGLISDVEGVNDQQVSLQGEAVVIFDDEKTSRENIIEAINKSETYTVQS